MKRLKPLAFLFMLAGIWFLASSDIDHPGNRYSHTPYFMERSELERSVFYVPQQRDMQNPGKIWVSGDRIYVVERYKGVHIIDNSTPADPRQTGFIVAPGCMDVAVKENVMYLDNAVDLVALELGGMEVTERIKNYFPEPASPSGERHRGSPSGMILVGWKKNN